MNKTQTKFEPGDYYVGDLCYMLRNEWDDVCNTMFAAEDAGGSSDGVFKLNNGIEFASYSTAYGDGVYTDQRGRKYPVDAGLIGCVNIKHLDANILKDNIHLGNIIKFNNSFETSSNDGRITIGHIIIDTKGLDESDDY